MSRFSLFFWISLVFASLAACAPGVPDSPTWADDVAPILAANCVRCHTVPAIGGAPDSFRLDTYDDWTLDDGRVIRGAGTMADYIRQRIAPASQAVPVMPPPEGFARLTDRQIDVLVNWTENLGSDGRPERGPARDGNRPPEMTIRSKTMNSDGALVIDYEIRDPDGEPVVGELAVGDSADGATVVSHDLHDGRGQVIWDIATFTPGTYGIFGFLHDPSGRHVVKPDMHDVPSTARAPAVTVVGLARDSLIASAETPTFDILVDIVDSDSMNAGDLTMAVKAYLGRTEFVVSPSAAATTGMNTVLWDLTTVPEGDAWHLEVTVNDQTQNKRVVDIGPFIVGRVAGTSETFQSISENVLGACTFCHPNKQIPGLTHDFQDHADQGDVRGVNTLRGVIYRRTVQQRNMPPVSSLITLGQEQIDRLREWLLAGAPQGVTP